MYFFEEFGSKKGNDIVWLIGNQIPSSHWKTTLNQKIRSLQKQNIFWKDETGSYRRWRVTYFLKFIFCCWNFDPNIKTRKHLIVFFWLLCSCFSWDGRQQTGTQRLRLKPASDGSNRGNINTSMRGQLEDGKPRAAGGLHLVFGRFYFCILVFNKFLFIYFYSYFFIF